MFLDKSRYAKVPTDSVVTTDGREATALRLRRLPATQGSPRLVKDGDRLDVIADRAFGEGTKFWHIADANTALQASDIVAEVLDNFNLPQT